jgi:hypothetical protein
MRLLLLLAVLALGTDALRYNGAYTQAAWREASTAIGRLLDAAHATANEADRKG